ncbi:MAG: zinc-ribbon domain-containing protein [Oscillospiraceae bacterium]|nr:zinc-ribbon domain-containing protein [Oscillospiraceae bacterium]
MDELKRWRIVELNPDVDIPNLPIQSGVAITQQCPNCSKISNTTMHHKIKHNKDGSYCMSGCSCNFTSVFAGYPRLKSEWDFLPNSVLCDPNKESQCSERKVFWKCQKGHSYKMSINQRVALLKRGKTACYYCKNITHPTTRII